MNCYNHADQVSVSQCRDCNKGLCDYCAHFYQVPLCISCNKLHIDYEKKKIKKEFFWTIVLGAVPATAMYFLLITAEMPPDKTINDVYLRALITFFVFAPIVPGWHALNSFGNNFKGIFLIFSLPGLFMFYILKAMVSIPVGLIALPIRFIRNTKRLNELNAIPLEYN